MVRFKAILPNPREPDINAMKHRFAISAEKYMEIARDDFKATVQSWKGEKPVFVRRTKLSDPKEITVTIFLERSDEGVQKWDWLDYGTEKHPIAANKSPVLAYQGVFKPKTRVGVFPSTPGGKSGEYVFRKAVEHPGIEARGWSDAILEKHEKPFAEWMEKAMKSVAEVSKHKA